MATQISSSPPTAKHGWVFWRRNAILFGLCCAEKSGSRDHRDYCWLLENAFVEWGLANRNLSRITAIGVDELLWRKGHQYVTVVYQIDAHAKRLLWVG